MYLLSPVPIYDGRRNDSTTPPRSGFEFTEDGFSKLKKLPRYLNTRTKHNIPASEETQFYVALIAFTASTFSPTNTDSMGLNARQLSFSAMFAIVLGHYIFPTTEADVNQLTLPLSSADEEITPAHIASMRYELYGGEPPEIEFAQDDRRGEDATVSSFIDDQAEEEEEVGDEDEEAAEEEEEGDEAESGEDGEGSTEQGDAEE